MLVTGGRCVFVAAEGSLGNRFGLRLLTPPHFEGVSVWHTDRVALKGSHTRRGFGGRIDLSDQPL